jgi:hypothetical protein
MELQSCMAGLSGRAKDGRAIRAKDVRACGMGAYAFYLVPVVRFYMTEEFSRVDDDFFCTNKNWFDFKLLLLVGCYSNDYCKEMSNDS